MACLVPFVYPMHLVLLVRYVRLPAGTSEIKYNPVGKSGFCVVSECDPDGVDLRFYLTRYGDFLDRIPPLSPHQLDAIAAVERMTTEEFLQSAHENGVHDDALIHTIGQTYNAERKSN